MKRCPQCNRVETDEALKFCRVDGATLISDSSALPSETGTVRLGSGSVATEIETSILPQTTNANINRTTAPTTMLPPQPVPSTTSELAKPKRRRPAIRARDSQRARDAIQSRLKCGLQHRADIPWTRRIRASFDLARKSLRSAICLADFAGSRSEIRSAAVRSAFQGIAETNEPAGDEFVADG